MSRTRQRTRTRRRERERERERGAGEGGRGRERGRGRGGGGRRGGEEEDEEEDEEQDEEEEEVQKEGDEGRDLRTTLFQVHRLRILAESAVRDSDLVFSGPGAKSRGLPKDRLSYKCVYIDSQKSKAQVHHLRWLLCNSW